MGKTTLSVNHSMDSLASNASLHRYGPLRVLELEDFKLTAAGTSGNNITVPINDRPAARVTGTCIKYLSGGANADMVRCNINTNGVVQFQVVRDDTNLISNSANDLISGKVVWFV